MGRFDHSPLIALLTARTGRAPSRKELAIMLRYSRRYQREYALALKRYEAARQTEIAAFYACYR